MSQSDLIDSLERMKNLEKECRELRAWMVKYGPKEHDLLCNANQLRFYDPRKGCTCGYTAMKKIKSKAV